MKSELLKFEGLSFRYSGNDPFIISDFSLSLSRGRKVGVVGQSGCGKSTLLALLAGFLLPTRGKIERDASISVGAGGKIGYIPQRDSLFPWRTVRDNLLLGSPERRLSGSLPLQKQLEAVGLSSDVLQKYPQALSVGMRKRIEVLRAGFSESPLVLADEPFSALDESAHQKTKAWLFAIAQARNAAIILASHDLADAVSFADDLIIFCKHPAASLKVLMNPAVGLAATSREAQDFRVAIAKEMGLV